MAMVLPVLHASAQLTLPEKAMGKPLVFMQESRSYEWEDIAAKKNWGDLGPQFWQVYIDREGVTAYEGPSSSSRANWKNLEFMSAYYVAKIEGDYALLYTEKYNQSNLQISPSAQVIGWVDLNNLLLWTSCPRTRGQVYKKAVILKDVEDLQDKEDIDQVSPYFSKSPAKMVSTGLRANELEFFFLFKRTSDGAALLIPESRIDGPNSLPRMKRYGWMKRSNYTNWNDRLCYEPTFDAPEIKYEAAVFREKPEARTYYQTGSISENALWHDKLPAKRWPAKKTRFPVWEVDKNNTVVEIGCIGGVGGTSKNSNDDAAKFQKQIDELNDKIDVLKKKMNQINVVFVIDGTGSMKDYYQPVARAVTDAMSRDAMKGANIRFGAVIYRNYADGDNVIEFMQLTEDATGVARWLVSRECHSEGKTHHEAMYHGLFTAIDKMNWNKDYTNFLIHIGDAGNEEPDEKNYTVEALAKKMAIKQINYIGFQTNRLDHIAYSDFSSQVMKLTVFELKDLLGAVKSSDFVEKENRLKEYTAHINGNQHILMAYHFEEVGNPANTDQLKDLIERKITEFKDITNTELLRFQRALDGMAADADVPVDLDRAIQFENIDQFLKERGLTEDEIKTWRKKGMVIKVKGFTSRTANSKEVFSSCVFMAKEELDQLITSLESLGKNTSTNRRKDLQNTLANLALSYLGQKNDGVLMIGEIMDAVSGLKKGSGKHPLAGIRLDRLQDYDEVTDDMIDNYIKEIKKDTDVLKRRRNDSSCYYDSPNGARYYYILMEDMPLQHME